MIADGLLEWRATREIPMPNNESHKLWVGFDLGGTKIMAVVYNDDFKKVVERRRKTKAHLGASAGLDRIVETIEQALADGGFKPDQIGGIGVGSPGPLDLEKGMILETPNLGWKDVRLKERLEHAFKCRAHILNDVDAGVFGEFKRGAARKARCVVGVFPGTGIGGGCVYEGRIIRGKNCSCFEIGHCRVQPDGPLCGCGRYGCLEAVASRLAISAAISAAAYRGEAPHLMAKAGTDLANIRSGMIADAIKEGDKAVERIVRHAAAWLGVGVGMAVNLMAPEIVVLGGGLVEAMPSIYREEVEKSARDSAMPSFRQTFEVRIAELGDYATALGAAAWARHCEVKEPEA